MTDKDTLKPVANHLKPTEKSAANEHIKWNSNYLRGDLETDVANVVTGNIIEDHVQLTKFHGTYIQDDRDIRAERRGKKLDKAYSFMIRMRVAGGVVTPEQWLKIDHLADVFANGTLKITTRQTFQVHGVIKFNLKDTFKAIDAASLDCIAACGDVNRNVIANTNPFLSKHHEEALKLADDISDHLLPHTNAYREIWLDGEKVNLPEDVEQEPLYGRVYLPRKFKIAVAVPPYNDVDVFAHCLGFIAIIENDKIVGYNISVGGGMGMTHGDKTTFPRTADVMAFCTPEQAIKVAEGIMIVQRDNGNREVRKHARFKYTVERLGAPKIRELLEEYCGFKLQDARPFEFVNNLDKFGWTEGTDGRFHCGLYIVNGRLRGLQKQGVAEIARFLGTNSGSDLRMTCNQNLVLCGITAENKPKVEALLAEYDLDGFKTASTLLRNSLACVSLPTCGLALAESERYFPTLIGRLIEKSGVDAEEITMRMTGCPNGCARPYLAEIGFVGTGPGKYNLYLGAAHNGDRLSKLYRESVDETQAIEILSPMLQSYAKERNDNERFGDYVIRKGIVAATTGGNNFHENLKLA